MGVEGVGRWGSGMQRWHGHHLSHLPLSCRRPLFQILKTCRRDLWGQGFPLIPTATPKTLRVRGRDPTRNVHIVMPDMYVECHFIKNTHSPERGGTAAMRQRDWPGQGFPSIPAATPATLRVRDCDPTRNEIFSLLLRSCGIEMPHASTSCGISIPHAFISCGITIPHAFVSCGTRIQHVRDRTPTRNPRYIVRDCNSTHTKTLCFYA